MSLNGFVTEKKKTTDKLWVCFKNKHAVYKKFITFFKKNITKHSTLMFANDVVDMADIWK